MRTQGTSVQDGTAAMRCSPMSFAGIFSLVLAGSLGISERAMAQVSSPETITLRGVVRDFMSSHPDFGITDPAQLGQYTNNIAPTLGFDGTPEFVGGGLQILSQWHDKDGNPITPYGDLGLPGGHFDTDVYVSAPSTSPWDHTHEFDDKYNVTYVDIANDVNLGFDVIVGSAYPNDLRLTMMNVHNGGGGTYVFEAGGPVEFGDTSDGFETTFSPALLTQLRVTMLSLDDMRPTSPNNSQGDAADRDDSLSIRMYDVTTDELVYELAVYHHFKANEPLPTPVSYPAIGEDACGVSLGDTVGSFGAAGSGAVTDSGTFSQWFKDVPGTNVSAAHSIALLRDGAGVYSYATDSFFPIDNRLFGNESDAHNNYFTYTFSAFFTYSQCTDLFFEFESNDDVWVFINGKKALDISGVATPTKQYVALDRLNLVDGEDYTLEFFYAHRRESPISLFNLRTNIVLRTPGWSLPPTSALYD